MFKIVNDMQIIYSPLILVMQEQNAFSEAENSRFKRNKDQIVMKYHYGHKQVIHSYASIFWDGCKSSWVINQP